MYEVNSNGRTSCERNLHAGTCLSESNNGAETASDWNVVGNSAKLRWSSDWSVEERSSQCVCQGKHKTPLWTFFLIYCFVTCRDFYLVSVVMNRLVSVQLVNNLQEMSNSVAIFLQIHLAICLSNCANRMQFDNIIAKTKRVKFVLPHTVQRPGVWQLTSGCCMSQNSDMICGPPPPSLFHGDTALCRCAVYLKRHIGTVEHCHPGCFTILDETYSMGWGHPGLGCTSIDIISANAQ